jgi:hypothetical protein
MDYNKIQSLEQTIERLRTENTNLINIQAAFTKIKADL